MLPRATYAPDETVYGEFNTFDAVTVELITLAGTPSLRLNRIRAGVRTEITGAGITLRVDEDDTGRHEYDIDLDAANITAAAGDEYTVAFNAGTVDGVPVEGVAIDRFAVQADGLTTQQKADVNAEVDTAVAGLATSAALQTVDDEIAAIDTDVNTLLARVTSTLFTGITSLAEWLGLIAGKQAADGTAQTEVRATGAGSGTYDATTDSQEAIRDRGDAAWAGTGATAGEIADAVLDEALSGHTTAGTLGKAVADIETDATAILADTNELQTDDVPGLIATAQADLDLLTGTDGATLATSQPNYAPATAAALTTHDGKLDTVDGIVDDILTDTGTTLPGTLTSIAAFIDTEVAAILVDTGTTLPDLIAALNDLSAAAVNAEVDTAIADAFGIVSGSVNDAGASATEFEVMDDADADIRLGSLRLTSGALAGESRLVTWTGTTVAVVEPTSVPAGLTTVGPFSAAPANGVTYTFRPL
jgi:hypothetical protein